MSGAYVEEAHHLYKEDDHNHIGGRMYVYVLIYGLFRHVALFSGLAKITMLFSTGCS